MSAIKTDLHGLQPELTSRDVAGGERLPRAVLLATGLAVFAVFLDTTILFVAFSAIGKSFTAATPSALSWVLNAYTIVFAAALIPAGRLADRIGRRVTFLWAGALFTLASMLCGVAISVETLVAARVLQALGAAALVPASLALVLQSVPRARVPAAVAIWSAVGAVAGAVGPTLGALVIQYLGWRWAFLINLPVGVVSLLLGRRVLREAREPHPGRFPDLISLALLVSALGAMAYAVVETSSWGWFSARFGLVFGGSLALLVAFIARSLRVENPLFQVSLFRSPSFALANAATLLFSVGFSAMFLGNVLFLTGVWHYDLLRAGLVVSVGPLVVATTAPYFGRLSGRIGQRSVIVAGGLIWAAGGLLLLMTASDTPHYLTQYLPAVLLTGTGVSLCLPQLSSAAVQGLAAAGFGAGSAVNQSLRNLGATLGVALCVALTSAETQAPSLAGFQRVWWLLLGCGVGVTSLAYFLPRGASRSVSAPVAPVAVEV